MTSVAETLLAVQLEQAGIPFEREFRFAPPRRWRADFHVPVPDPRLDCNGDECSCHGSHTIRDICRHCVRRPAVLVEIDGGGFVAGRHTRGTGFENDAEKASAAAILGYRVIRCTPRQVEDGRALSWILQALGVERAA